MYINEENIAELSLLDQNLERLLKRDGFASVKGNIYIFDIDRCLELQEEGKESPTLISAKRHFAKKRVKATGFDASTGENWPAKEFYDSGNYLAIYTNGKPLKGSGLSKKDFYFETLEDLKNYLKDLKESFVRAAATSFLNTVDIN